MLKKILIVLTFLGVLYSCSKSDDLQTADLKTPLLTLSNGKSKVVYNKGDDKVTYVAASGKEGTLVFEGKGNETKGSQSKSIHDEINFEFNNLDWTMTFGNFVQETDHSITYTATYSDQIGSTDYRLEMEDPISLEEFQSELIGEHDLSSTLADLSAIAAPGAKCAGLCFTIIGIGMAIGYGISNHCQNVVDTGVANCDQCYEVGACSVNCHACEEN